ncbi:unnamed protein product [Ilex paraguariensis]|uniref:RNA polymerase sigma-70 domain-containing protein n=1 Tax=Ilex paraguariensis TaxID=185542 RepID=A0ABC8SYL8_9AQUA
MGAEMADLVQGGLIGLLRGIEKFDSSKGFKISTYVYWWIRQNLKIAKPFAERLSLIRNAKSKLEEKGIMPSIDRIAERLNMSQKKVRNATEAINKVFSVDREAFPSLNGLPGETLHSYIADNCLENNPWHGVDEWALKKDLTLAALYWEKKTYLKFFLLLNTVFPSWFKQKGQEEKHVVHRVDAESLKDNVPRNLAHMGHQ